MEQYWMPKQLDFENLRLCVENYKPIFLHISLVDERYKSTLVHENLTERVFDFKKDENGLHMLIDSKEIFNFPLKRYPKGFSLVYNRYNKGGIRLDILNGENPDDINLPEPKESILRNVIDHNLLEICFNGKINIKFHSYLLKPTCKYWTINK